MKSKYFTNFKVVLLGILVFNILGNVKGQVVKFELSPSMIINECGFGDAGMIADEQVLSGDPLTTPSTHPVNTWATPYGKPYPMAARIDLGSMMKVVHIFVYDRHNVGDLIVEYGQPGSWQYLFTDPLVLYKKWVKHTVNVNTRYLHFIKTSANVNFSEIVIYVDNIVLPPPIVSNLEASNPKPFSATLNWTDVAGNSTTGTFLSYDIRYSDQPIDEQSFGTAHQFPTELVPSAGEEKQITISGLEADKKYYFGLKLLGESANSSLSNVVSLTTTNLHNHLIFKVDMTPDMVTNEAGYGVAEMLVDEQAISGNVIAGIGGVPINGWNPGNFSTYYPASAYIDLDIELPIAKIFLFDAISNGEVIIEYGSPGNWNFLFIDQLNNIQNWNEHYAGISTRYLRFTKTSPDSEFNEVVIYGIGELLVETKIPLGVDMITNLSNYGEPWKLLDEQELAGDPANSPGGNPVTFWQTGFQSYINYPLFALIDLGKTHHLSKMFLRDINDYGNFAIWGGYHENWDLLAVDNLTGYLSWNQHDADVFTRYLLLEKQSARSNVSEIVLYGYDIMPGYTDTVPPSAVNLVATQQGCCSVLLEWTAPGDDGLIGKASEYMIKYSQNPITVENFYNTASVPGIPIPGQAGMPEALLVESLTPETNYYFAIVSMDDAQNFSTISNIAVESTIYQIGGLPYKFNLRSEMILNEWVQGDATLLVDEQGISGNPREDAGGNPVNRWEIGSTLWKYPAFAIIDLQGLCNITDIFVYDDDDSGQDSTSPVTFFYGEPFNWQPLFVDSLKNSGVWNQHNINLETRYLRVKIHSPETRMSELLVYGTRIEDPVQEPVEQPAVKVTMDQLIGINAFITSPLGKMKCAGFVREYHNWMWCEGNRSTTYPGYPNNQNEFITLGWNFDVYYSNLNNSGITISPAIQNTVLWLNGFNYNRLADKPVLSGLDPLLPSSYIQHADHIFQYTARYGSKTLPDNLLKLAPGQPRITGANSIKYIENWNEQDRWWESRGAFFTPYEYAAMASADYDGHLGILGETLGLKNADPDAKLVMGGIAKPDINYIKAIKLWSDFHRNGSVPFDVINVHHYCNDGADQASGSVGISPEADNLKGLMQQFVSYRNKYLPGKEVWITEFGYDTHPESVQRAPAIGTFSQEEVQGQWLVRSYLALAAAGVDKAAMYMLSDVDPTDKTKFQTSGLICVPAEGYRSKTSWYYVYTLKNRLTDMYFDQEIASGNPDVMIYKFKHANDPNYSAYVLWCPTSNQTTVDDFAFQLHPNEKQAKLVELSEGSINGVENIIPTVDDKVILNISERPVILIVANEGFVFPLFKQEVKLGLSPEMMVNESGYGDAAMLVDEQDISGDPLNNPDTAPQTCWTGGYSAPYPCHVYIDLGNEYDITSIYLRDLNGVGDVTFSSGEPGAWTPEFVDDCKLYKAWTGHVINKKTRYIRVTKHSPDSHIAEMIIYVSE